MKTRRAWYETGAVSPDSPSSPAHNAPDDRQYSKRRGLDPAALSLRPCCFGVLGVISFFGGASTAPAIRGCRACTGEGSRTRPRAIGPVKPGPKTGGGGGKGGGMGGMGKKGEEPPGPPRGRRGGGGPCSRRTGEA